MTAHVLTHRNSLECLTTLNVFSANFVYSLCHASDVFRLSCESDVCICGRVCVCVCVCAMVKCDFNLFCLTPKQLSLFVGGNIVANTPQSYWKWIIDEAHATSSEMCSTINGSSGDGAVVYQVDLIFKLFVIVKLTHTKWMYLLFIMKVFFWL